MPPASSSTVANKYTGVAQAAMPTKPWGGLAQPDGKKAEAKAFYEQVIKGYPNTSPAPGAAVCSLFLFLLWLEGAKVIPAKARSPMRHALDGLPAQAVRAGSAFTAHPAPPKRRPGTRCRTPPSADGSFIAFRSSSTSFSCWEAFGAIFAEAGLCPANDISSIRPSASTMAILCRPSGPKR